MEISNGYNVITLSPPSEPKRRILYRVDELVGNAFLVQDEKHNFLSHINGNELDDNVENLEWTTQELHLARLYGNVWKPVVGVPNYYVSNTGQVWSEKTRVLIKTQLHAGYESVNIGYPKAMFKHLHRLIGEAHLPNPENLPMIVHKNGDLSDYRLENLMWGSDVIRPTNPIKSTCEPIQPTYDPEEPYRTLDYLPGYKIYKDGRIYNMKMRRFKNWQLNTTGYYRIDHGKSKYYVHRVVAEAFLEKTPSQTQVNHKDFNRANNHVDNLEWCTSSENNQHAKDNNPEQYRHTMKKVGQYDLETKKLIKIHDGMKIASRETGINSGSISKVVNGKSPSAGGFFWKFI